MKKLGKHRSSPTSVSQAEVGELLSRTQVLLHQHQYALAQPLLESVYRIAPQHPDVLTRLGICYLNLGQLTQAERLFRQLVTVNPNMASGWHNLGLCLTGQGQWAAAVQSGEKALKLAPQNIHFLTQLADYCRQLGERRRVKALLEQVLRLEPNHLGVVHNLALLLDEMEDFDQALPYWERTYHEDTSHLRWSAAMSLGVIYSKLGRMDLSWPYWYEAYENDPHDPDKLSNLLFYLYADPEATYEDIFTMQRRYGEQFTDPLLPTPLVFTNQPDPERPLKVGYVSGDFRTHSVVGIFGWLLENGRNPNFEVYAYANNAINDATGEGIRDRIGPAHWRSIFGMPDDTVVKLIQADQIDILVDLSGHTLGRRLQVFAHKPAPIQITGWGFGSTTGMKAMDYRVSDPYQTPEHLYGYNTEKIWLNSSVFHFWVTDAHLQDPSLAPPALTNGYVTFGYGNNPFKLNEPLIDCWATILQAVPDSRLHLKFTYMDHPLCEHHYRQLFQERGIAPERLLFLGKTDGNAHRAFYSSVDVVLDPFPYNGGISTLDALWMNRPVVVLAGGTRSGVSILNVLGRPEWVAQTVTEYVAIAVELAQHPDPLNQACGNLRQHVLDSPICNRQQFVTEVEAGYRQMWREWCATYQR